MGLCTLTDPEAEPDWVKGSCAISAVRLKEGPKTSPAVLVLSIYLQVLSPGQSIVYCQIRGTLYLPRPYRPRHLILQKGAFRNYHLNLIL